MAGSPREVFRPVGWRSGSVINYFCDTCKREFQSSVVNAKECPYCTSKVAPEIWQPMDIADSLNKNQTVTVRHLIPEWRLIPDTYKGGSQWAVVARDWYQNGLNHATFKTKPGIDQYKAFEHIRAIFAMDKVKAEHKTAAAAYLMAQWFESADYEIGRR